MDEEFLKLTGFTIDHLVGFFISVGIGFLIGLERQFTKEVNEKEEQFAGVRTYTMVSIFGFLAAFLSTELGGWLFGIALGGLFVFVIVSYFRIAGTTGNRGGTSEIATIITFLLGAMVYFKFILF